MGDRSGSDVALGSGTHRAHLTRERIIQVAIEYVDDHGLTALTMRRLGKELGVEAMSLYRYVNGREDLLEGMVDHMVATLHMTSRPVHSGRPTAGRPTSSGSRTASGRSPASIRTSFR